jgi:hypothetical protein
VRRWVRRAAAVVVAVAVTAGIAALSRVPYTHGSGGHAVLRLAFRTPGEFVEACRRPSEEELARLPVHMRRDEICEGRLLPRRLVVRLDGAVVVDDTVQAPGARGDRPLSVFREIPLAPGRYALEVVWETIGAPPAAAAAQRRVALPPRMAVETALHLEDRDVALITYDADRRILEAVGRGIVRGAID